MRILASFCMFQSFISCQQHPQNIRALAAAGIGFTPVATPCKELDNTLPPATNIVFQSLDGGQSWQDVSAGLPADLKVQDVIVDGDEIYLSADEGVLFRAAISAVPLAWEQENGIFQPEKIMNIFQGQGGLYACTPQGVCFQKIAGLGLWMTVYPALEGEWVHSILEAPGGVVLAGSDNGIFKSADGGKTVKQVFSQGTVTSLLAFNDVLFACGKRGVLRSDDGGEHWDWVLKAGLAVKTGVAAGNLTAIVVSERKTDMTSADNAMEICLYTSADMGQTWQGMDEHLPPAKLVLDIKQAGKYLLCSFDTGIFRSADQGKTWELVFPTNGKFFTLAVSGEVIFIAPSSAGC